MAWSLAKKASKFETFDIVQTSAGILSCPGFYEQNIIFFRIFTKSKLIWP